MTSGSSSTEHPSPSDRGDSSKGGTPEKHRRVVDIGRATILAACITAAGVVLAAFIGGRASVSGATPTPTASSKATYGPTSVAITPPKNFNIPLVNTLSGHEVNLQHGELVWTFNQYVSKDGSFSQRTYPNSGPCTVDYTRQTWVCSNIYIGSANDNRSYKVCAAILSTSDALQVVNLLRNTRANRNKDPNLRFWFNSPPPYIHDATPACMAVHRIG
jgi:hypothetical protein